MSIFSKVKPIEVTDKNPHEHDALDRERDCLFLVDLIEKSDTPFTLAVDAEWGNGKTVFIKMLQAHLRKRGFRCVFFNAWECDFYSEPLAPLIAEISEQIPPHSSIGKTLREKGSKLVQYIKEATSASHPSIAAILKIIEVVSDNTKPEVLGSIGDYEAYRDALKDFKKSLEEFSSERQDGRSLVVLIDDLDRCRPDFAINMLERVKHIFDVPLLFFVIAINKKEFRNVVKSFYGCEDGERYLEKFFDLVFHLRNEKTLINSSLDKTEFENFRERIDLLTQDRLKFKEADYREWFARYLESVSKVFQLPLRVQEKLVKMLGITLNTVDYQFLSRYSQEFDQSSPYWQIMFRCPLICYFLALRIANPDLFHRSVESETAESFPWGEHIKFYFDKSGVEKEISLSGQIDAFSLRNLKSNEHKIVILSLVAAVHSLGKETLVMSSLSDILEGIETTFSNEMGLCSEVLKIDSYYSFREFLKAIDFAGKFYEPEGNYLVKSTLEEIMKSAKLQKTKD